MTNQPAKLKHPIQHGLSGKGVLIAREKDEVRFWLRGRETLVMRGYRPAIPAQPGAWVRVEQNKAGMVEFLRLPGSSFPKTKVATEGDCLGEISVMGGLWGGILAWCDGRLSLDVRELHLARGLLWGSGEATRAGVRRRVGFRADGQRRAPPTQQILPWRGRDLVSGDGGGFLKINRNLKIVIPDRRRHPISCTSRASSRRRGRSWDKVTTSPAMRRLVL